VDESCTGWDGEAEIKVRYVVDTTVTGELYGCVLTDSNGLILGAPVDIGMLPGDAQGQVIYETDLLTCSEELAAGEPDTATLTCQCFEEQSGIERSDTDIGNFECQAVDLTIDKTCEPQDVDSGENAVTIVVTNPADPRGATLMSCVVTDPLAMPVVAASSKGVNLRMGSSTQAGLTASVGGFVSDPFDLMPGESRQFDLVVHGLTEDTLNEASVTCEIVGSGGKTITREDQDLCEARECEISLDKQVSCDGGNTFVDVGDVDESCIGFDDEAGIVVRYVADTSATGDLVNCVLTDSNGMILGAPVDIGTLPGDAQEQVIYQTDAKACSEDLAAGEPDTATLTCECFEAQSGFERSATDIGNFECQVPDVQLDKECEDQDASGINAVHLTVTNPDHPRGASLSGCVVTDPLAGFTSQPFDLAPGGSAVFDTGIDGLTDDTLNTAEVVCDVVGATDKTVSDTAEADCVAAFCEIVVKKTCFVEPQGDDDDDDDCNGKVVSMKLQYTGEGCTATNNPQEGKAGCVGGAGFAEPVDVRITDDRGSKVYGAGAMFLGDVIEASAANAGASTFASQTDVSIDDGLEEITFHTSCSKPLAVGDQFGSMLLVELTTTEGGTVTLPPPEPEEPTDQCTIPAPPPPPHCEGRVEALSLRYLGGDCSATTNPQEGKALCNGDADGTEPVRIRCFKDASQVWLDTGDPASVWLGDVVEASAANAGQSTFGSDTFCEIYDEFGNWVQDLKFHTSCSKPLNLGDRFGALEIFGMDTTENTPISLAVPVIYTYEITNLSGQEVQNVTVVDDPLGVVPGSPIDSIGAMESVTLETTALISEDTVNTVTVNAMLANGRECPAATDTATVTVEETPQIVECTSKIQAMLLEYIGPDLAGPVTVGFAGDKFRGDPAVYELPGGLTTGTVLMLPSENDWTVDATAHNQQELGSKSYIWINGVVEVIHTSCSTPFVAGKPAPLDSPKGDPSPNWFVQGFSQN